MRTQQPVELTHEEVAGRLRIAVNRLQRRLRQESLGGLSPAQASALGSVAGTAAPRWASSPPSSRSSRRP